MNLLRQENTMRRGMRTERIKAGWSDAYLARVLAAASISCNYPVMKWKKTGIVHNG